MRFAIILGSAAVALSVAACHSSSTRPVAASTTPVAAETTPVAATTQANDPARADAIQACRTWAAAVRQASPQRAEGVTAAAGQAAAASKLDARWNTLASDMSFVSSLPATGNTDSDIRKATAAQHEIAATCADLGVRIH